MPTNFLERPELALANLIRGEPGASLRALFRPSSLSPLEQRDFSAMLGLKEGENSFTDALVGIATNPFVVLGTIASMRYPVATLKNMSKFSKQVVDAAGRFGFMSKLKDFTQIFRDRPKLVEAWTGAFHATHEVKSKYMQKAANIMNEYAATAGTPFGPKEDFIVSMVMRNLHNGVAGYKNLPSPLNREALLRAYTPAMQKAADKFRGLYDDFWTNVVDTPEARKAMQKVATGRGLALGGRKANFMPSLLDRSALSIEMEQAFMAQHIGQSQAAMGRANIGSIWNRVAGSFREKKYSLLPNPRQLEKFPEFINKEGMAALDLQVAKNPKISFTVGDETIDFATVYETGLGDSLSKYVSTMAATHGWTIKGMEYKGARQGFGAIIGHEVQALRNLRGVNIARATLVENTYIPLAKGLLTPKQAMASQQWGATMHWTVEKLTGNGALAKLVPADTKRWLLEAVAKDRGPLSLQNVTGGAAGWLYIGTLGANAGSATLNLMQNFLTTAPLIGKEATLKGMSITFQKGRKFFNLRKSGVKFEDAIAQAFPDYAASGISGHSIADDAIRNAFGYAWDESGVNIVGRYNKGYDRVKRALMAMFSHTEQFNRITAFEGAMWKGAKEGTKGPELLARARDVVAKTQFMAGVEYAPQFLVEKNPLVRQYLMFPSKMLEFIRDTATSTASGVQAGFMGRNWGTLGRAVAASGAIYEGGKALGMDLSGGLLTGTLPVPRTDSPFGIFPFVPPAAALAGSLIEAAWKGDTTPLRRSVPMLVPGGLAAARYAGFVPGTMGPKTAKFLGRHYADYEQRGPNGGIAVFSKNGSLVGYESVMEMILKGSGIPGTGADIRQESETIQMLLQNRDRIREARNEYMNAMFLGDYAKMAGIREAYERAYGLRLEIKKEHIEAMQMKRMIPRLERVLQTLPPEHRQQFAQIIQSAIFAQGSQFLGIDPSLLGRGSIQSRRPTPLPSGFHRQGSYQGQMGPFGQMNAGGLGRNVLPNPTASSPLSMGTY